MTRDLCVQPISPKFHKVCSSAAARGSSKATALKSWSWEYLQVGITSPSKLLSVDLRDDLCIWNGAQILTLASWWQQEGGRQGVNALLWRVAFTSLPLGYQLPIRVVCLLSRYCSRTMASSGAPLARLPALEDIPGTPVLLYMLTGTEGQVLGNSIPS